MLDRRRSLKSSQSLLSEDRDLLGTLTETFSVTLTGTFVETLTGTLVETLTAAWGFGNVGWDSCDVCGVKAAGPTENHNHVFADGATI